MELPVWIFVVLALVIAAQMLIAFKQKPVEYKYTLKTALMTPAERSFYGVLSAAVEDSLSVFSKVRVADVLTPQRGLGRKSRQSAFNKISSKHFDFVLCRKDDLSVACAIELNDKSHNSGKRQLRDTFLTKACDSAGLALLNIPAKRSYNKEELGKQIALLIQDR